jgi:hypothetical protein
MVEKLDSCAGGGYVGCLALTALLGIVAGLTVPSVDMFLRTPKVAERYAIKRYGDHVAPFTVEERAEWHKDMHVEYGKKPTLDQLYHFRENCHNNVFF